MLLGANYPAEIRFYANHRDPQLSLLVHQLSSLQGIRRIEHLPKSDVGWKVEQSPMFFPYNSLFAHICSAFHRS